MDETADRGADVIFDPIGGEQTETIWTCGALGGRYLAVGFNDDPESGLTGRALRKLSMANMTALGVLLAYLDTPATSAGSASTPSRPRPGSACTRPARPRRRGQHPAGVGRRIGLDDVGAALADHAARRTSGRTVVDRSPDMSAPMNPDELRPRRPSRPGSTTSATAELPRGPRLLRRQP